MKKGCIISSAITVMLVLGYVTAHFRLLELISEYVVPRIFEHVLLWMPGDDSISIFTSLIIMYIILTLLLCAILSRRSIKDTASKLLDNVFPTVLSSMTVFFTIAIVLGIEDGTKPDATILSILDYFIKSNAYLGTVYIIILLFYFSLMTAVKIVGSSQNN